MYGVMIKEAREKLNAYQRDLANEHLSRNLLSNIESNKTSLTPQKGLIIYRKLIELALKRAIVLDIEFDDLLGENVHYQALKKGYNAVLEFQDNLNKNAPIPMNTIKEYIKLADLNKIGILRYYIYFYSAAYMETSVSKMKTYFKALDYLKWQNMEHFLMLYQNCIDQVRPIAYQVLNFESLIHYYEVLLDAQKIHLIRVKPSLYYNLSLLHNRVGQYEESLVYLDQYFESNRDLSLTDRVDALIVKAILLTKTHQIDDGLKLYDDILEMIDQTGHIKQRSICLSNLIYNIAKYNIVDKMDLLHHYLIELVSLLHDLDDNLASRTSMLSNIALGYYFLDNHESALDYFNKCLSLVKQDQKKVIILREAFETYLSLNMLADFIKPILTVQTANLSMEVAQDLYRLLLRVRSAETFKQLTKSEQMSFDLYINRL